MTRGEVGGAAVHALDASFMRVRVRVLVVMVALLLVGCGTTRRAATGFRPANCAWRVCLLQDNATTGRTYRVENGEPVPVTVGLAFREVENLIPPPDDTVRLIVPPYSTAYVPLRARRTGRAYHADVSIAIDLGASSTTPDAFVYAVPFGGTARRPLIQAFGGEGTHLGSMHYSLDFGMPRGTPVLAAREGVVLYLQDGFTEGGADPRLLERANLVVVAHEDGTMASYGHLAPGVAVSVGDTVQEGEVLGRSGRTGFAGQPHLHFHVGLRMLGEPGRTIPIQMRDRDGEIIELVEGTLVPPARPR